MFVYCKCALYGIYNYNFTFPLACVWARTKYNTHIKYYRDIFKSSSCAHTESIQAINFSE